MKSDLEIAQAATLRPILDIAESVGLQKEDLEPYGWYKAKVHLDVRDRLAERPSARYIDVTAITPTPSARARRLPRWASPLGASSASGCSPASVSPPWAPPLASWRCAGGGYRRSSDGDFNLHSPATSTPSVAHNHAAATTGAAPRAALLRPGPRASTQASERRPVLHPRTASWTSKTELRDIVIGLGGPTNGAPRQTG